jgi:5-methylcytosine-specific restriction endonuclease McrA
MSTANRRFQALEAIYHRLFHEQHGQCFYCQQLMLLPDPEQTQRPLPPARITIEHLIPRTHGGTDDPHNVVGACSRCNNERGSDIPWIEFLALKLQQAWAVQ